MKSSGICEARKIRKKIGARRQDHERKEKKKLRPKGMSMLLLVVLALTRKVAHFSESYLETTRPA